MADQEDIAADLTSTLASHSTVTVEKGRFISAQCSCGWRGPARRARSKARTDAAEHEESP
ncbi:hypothetical protein [Streptomyces sp. NPDC018059]|uniref:hypothetical protein n=1 Tax=Streptomyces TaxID=1883 RepID=UPI0037A538D6